MKPDYMPEIVSVIQVFMTTEELEAQLFVRASIQNERDEITEVLFKIFKNSAGKITINYKGFPDWGAPVTNFRALILYLKSKVNARVNESVSLDVLDSCLAKLNVKDFKNLVKHYALSHRTTLEEAGASHLGDGTLRKEFEDLLEIVTSGRQDEDELTDKEKAFYYILKSLFEGTCYAL